ncbi:hypothetical protein BLNAU_10071 [Blattamonas nauphoetae]|uniref:Uncharacterized protein n=1 Tax=Blattamonas nauphoetae TaxID=2049346 RepID=A0ABQ9XTX7_9EUKA|nr:hypothetical protein BLNAU_10071 [Blattamonas nauphoetae]
MGTNPRFEFINKAFLQHKMSSIVILGSSQYCGQAVIGHVFSILALACQTACIVWLILWVIMPTKEFCFSVKKWFHLTRSISLAFLAITMFPLFFPRGSKQHGCYVIYFDKNWLWCRIAIFALAIGSGVVAMLQFLPISLPLVFKWIDCGVAVALTVFLWIHHLATSCSVPAVGWRIVYSQLSLFIMPTVQFLSVVMILFEPDIKGVKQT